MFIKNDWSSRQQKVREEISIGDYAASVLEHRGNKLICPYCGSGTHGKCTPAFSIDKKTNRFKCFSCEESGSTIDLAMKVNNLIDVNSAVETLEQWAGLATGEGVRTSIKPQKAQTLVSTPVDVQKPSNDRRQTHRAYIETRARDIELPAAVAYLNSRGISLETAREHRLGYDAASNRLVIPYTGSEFYHVDRDTTGNAAHKYEKPKSSEVGTEPLYGINYLQQQQEPVFIVEGALDALAIENVGAPAIALCGTGSNKLIKALSTVKQPPMLLLSLDNDKAGREAAERVATQLQVAGVVFAHANLVDDEYKDASEAAQRLGSETWAAVVAQATADAKKKYELEVEQVKTNRLKSLHVLNAEDVIVDLANYENVKPVIPTGLDSLDEVINGGLSTGLYVLGAMSSLGKTTLCIQIADHIAAARRGVLFVTVEQSAREIVAKSISRLMYEMNDSEHLHASCSSITLHRNEWTLEKHAAFNEAAAKYTDVIAPNMHLLEADGLVTVEQIKAAAEVFAELDGTAPVIFIDYLQLLAAADPRESDKQAVDHNVTALRQLARELDTPVVVVSTLNRDSYTGTVEMSSFKESGAIEYGADVLLGLQPYGRANTIDKAIAAKTNERQSKNEISKTLRNHKNAKTRGVELVVLKQRAGATPASGIPLLFSAVNSHYSCTTNETVQAIEYNNELHAQ